MCKMGLERFLSEDRLTPSIFLMLLYAGLSHVKEQRAGLGSMLTETVLGIDEAGMEVLSVENSLAAVLGETLLVGFVR